MKKLKGELHSFAGVRFTGVVTPTCLHQGCDEPGPYLFTFPYLDAKTGVWAEYTGYYCWEHYPEKARQEALLKELKGEDL